MAARVWIMADITPVPVPQGTREKTVKYRGHIPAPAMTGGCCFCIFVHRMLMKHITPTLGSKQSTWNSLELGLFTLFMA